MREFVFSSTIGFYALCGIEIKLPLEHLEPSFVSILVLQTPWRPIEMGNFLQYFPKDPVAKLAEYF
jgi:hypothetical protein